MERVMSGSSSAAFCAIAFVFWLSLCSGSIGQESRDETLKKRCDEVGVPCVLKIGNKPSDGEQTPIEFLLNCVRRESK
jgi:hypothetical protein